MESIILTTRKNTSGKNKRVKKFIKVKMKIICKVKKIDIFLNTESIQNGIKRETAKVTDRRNKENFTRNFLLFWYVKRIDFSLKMSSRLRNTIGRKGFHRTKLFKSFMSSFFLEGE